MSHTPGPWRTYNEAGSPAVYAILSEHGESVRHVTVAQQLRPSDALLIAAAPDLLEQLKQTVRALEYWFPHCGDPGGVDSEMMKNARAAIAKADDKSDTHEEG